MTATDPGLYPNIPYAEYDSWPYMRVSTLKHAGSSCRHLKWAIDGRLERSDSVDMRLGRAIHCRLLEPEAFGDRFPQAFNCCALLKSGDNKGQPCGCESKVVDRDGNWFCGKHKPLAYREPEDFVTMAESETLEELNHEIRLHPVVRLLRKHGGCEVSIVADIEGVRMKCRLDKFIEADGEWPATVVDLKTIQSGSGSIETCRKAAANYSYHVQAATYQRALQQVLGVEQVAVVFVFVEKNCPYDCTVLQASESDMAKGNLTLETWLRAYSYCLANDKWPGCCEDIEHGILPDYFNI